MFPSLNKSLISRKKLNTKYQVNIWLKIGREEQNKTVHSIDNDQTPFVFQPTGVWRHSLYILNRHLCYSADSKLYLVAWLLSFAFRIRCMLRNFLRDSFFKFDCLYRTADIKIYFYFMTNVLVLLEKAFVTFYSRDN